MQTSLDALEDTVLFPGDMLGTTDSVGNMRKTMTFNVPDWESTFDFNDNNVLMDATHKGANEEIELTITFDFVQAGETDGTQPEQHDPSIIE